MKEINQMTLAELKALEKQIEEAKAVLKESTKADKAKADESAIENCNKAIADGTLRKGSNVVILYKGKELDAVVVTDPSTSRPTINCNSLSFDGQEVNGEKRRYIDKKNFVKVAE